MKKIEDMAPEEIAALVSYEGKNLVIYYSRLTNINTETGTLTYEGSDKYTAQGETLADILAGKARYEAYILLMSQSEAKSLLTEVAEDVLSKKFADQIAPTLEMFNDTFTELHTTFSKAKDTLAESSDVSEKISALKNKLSKTVDDFDTAKIQEGFKAKLDELKPVTTEVTKVVTELKKLFN